MAKVLENAGVSGEKWEFICWIQVQSTAPGAQRNWGITGVTGGKDLRLIPDQKLKLGQQYHEAKGKANGVQGKGKSIMCDGRDAISVTSSAVPRSS